ncbi:MAG: wax ester/triacylglycerol synthase family O-acyltransferase [Ideonella sp.]|nr:wax ester/triacylglycerol synthase family O-acyltransferase [Ideonella sp.]
MYQPMNVLDAGLLLMESAETPMHIGGVQVLELPPGAAPDHVYRLYQQMLDWPASGAPFNFRLARTGRLGLPAWELLPHVDLTEHVFHHALPWPHGERELMALVSRLNSGRLDRSKPMWEQHLIEGLAGGRYATFTRIHHALMDGQWGMRLAFETTSTDPNETGLPPYWGVHFGAATRKAGAGALAEAADAESWWARQSRTYAQGVKTLGELRTAFGRVVESFRHPTDDGLVPIYTAPESLLNGPLTPRRELAVVRLDLERIKRLAHAHTATVNEVVLTLCGSALRRYLIARGELPERPLIANMPIAMQRPGGAPGGNALISGMVSLGTHIEDPERRFSAVRGSSRHAKAFFRDMPSQAAVSAYLGVTGIPFVLAQATGNVERVHPQNLVISNVPGPREKRYVNGALILAEYPMSLLIPGQAMNITVVSHADRLDVAVLVCPSLVPHPERVAQGIASALDELDAALAAAPVPAPAPPPAPRKTRSRRKPAP